MEFFHECVKDVAPDLLNAFTTMLKEGETSPFINKGQITLIPKSGDQARLGNWRPITLLGILYKILAKVLAGRVQGVFPHVIRPNQTEFVEGRSILDNMYLAQEALESNGRKRTTKTWCSYFSTLRRPSIESNGSSCSRR
jgi:hypothetical protein